MEQILVRGGADPTKHYSPKQLLITDSLGGNSGNLMFLYGTMNVLTTSKTRCVPTYYKANWTEKEIEEINQSCSAFVLPLADAFRASFCPTLNKLTNLMKKLRIPCIINGVGLRAKYEPDPEFSFPFNDDVKRFVSEVLNHSAMLGLRGEITGDYLKSLGFLPERDYTVIGCPSLYTYGELKENKHPENERLAVSLNGIVPAKLEKLYVDLISRNENTHIIQQRTDELMDLYYASNLDLCTKSPEFDRHNIFEAFDYAAMKASGRVQFFTDIPSWIHYLKPYALFVGARFHGAAAAILAGVPTILTPFDARTRELSSYHCIPTITEADLEKGLKAESIQEVADYGQILRAHKRNLSHYKNFLKCNGLSVVFDEQDSLSFGLSPMEKQSFHNWSPKKLITSYEQCSVFERMKRNTEYFIIKSSKRAYHVLK